MYFTSALLYSICSVKRFSSHYYFLYLVPALIFISVLSVLQIFHHTRKNQAPVVKKIELNGLGHDRCTDHFLQALREKQTERLINKERATPIMRNSETEVGETE